MPQDKTDPLIVVVAPLPSGDQTGQTDAANLTVAINFANQLNPEASVDDFGPENNLNTAVGRPANTVAAMILEYRTPLVPEPEPVPNVTVMGRDMGRVGRDLVAVGNLPEVLAFPFPDDIEILAFWEGGGDYSEEAAKVDAPERFRAFEARVLGR
jgi:hypothetical protein